MDNRDKQLDENLHVIGRRVPRPADASPEQVRHWVEQVQSSRSGRIRRLAGVWARPAVRRWAFSAAAAAVLVLGLFVAFETTPQSVSAEDVFKQVGATLHTQPVLHLTVEDVELQGHRLNLEFIGADDGKSVFANINAKSLAGDTENTLGLDMTLARDGKDSWVLVRRMQWNDRRPMGHLIPENGALLIDVPVSRSTNEAVREALPMAIRLRDVQALIESLRQAVPALEVRELDDGTVLLEGVITRPNDLNVRMLDETTDAARMFAGLSPALMSGMTQQDFQKVVGTIKETLSERLSEEDLETVSARLDLVSLVAMQQLQAGKPVRNDDTNEKLDEALRTLLTGATITIVYDPAQKLLRRVVMENIGPSQGTLRLRFDEPDINRSLLNRKRFANKPKLRRMTRDEVIHAMLLPMLLPDHGKSAEGK